MICGDALRIILDDYKQFHKLFSMKSRLSNNNLMLIQPEHNLNLSLFPRQEYLGEHAPDPASPVGLDGGHRHRHHLAAQRLHLLELVPPEGLPRLLPHHHILALVLAGDLEHIATVALHLPARNVDEFSEPAGQPHTAPDHPLHCLSLCLVLDCLQADDHELRADGHHHIGVVVHGGIGVGGCEEYRRVVQVLLAEGGEEGLVSAVGLAGIGRAVEVVQDHAAGSLQEKPLLLVPRYVHYFCDGVLFLQFVDDRVALLEPSVGGFHWVDENSAIVPGADPVIREHSIGLDWLRGVLDHSHTHADARQHRAQVVQLLYCLG